MKVHNRMGYVASLPGVLTLHGQWCQNSPALISDAGEMSWGAFDAATNRVANSLVSMGLQAGDKVAVLMSNSLEMVQILFGIAKAGCCSVPLNLSVSDDALSAMIGDCGAKLLFVSADQADRSVASGLQSITVDPGNKGACAYTAWLAGDESAPDCLVDPDQAMNIIYSSGTTGTPKGIIATFEGRLNWAYDLALDYGFTRDTKTLIATGIYSNISWATMLSTLLAGGTVYIGPNKFDVEDTLGRIEGQSITHFAMVPVQYQRLMESERFSSTDLSSIACAITVGAPMHEGMKKALYARLNGNLYEIYGLTEGIITIMRGTEMPGRWQSAGKPLVGSDIAIVDENCAPVPQCETGEIIGLSRFVMPGYHGRDEATAEALWQDDKGRKWLRTGDIGYLDEDGYLFVVDRKKDMILSGGQNIYPADIEAELIKHNGVREVAVVGAKSEKWGETPLALVVPEDKNSFDAELTMSAVNKELGKQQRLAAIEVLDALPRNANGKILKRELRELYKDRVYG